MGEKSKLQLRLAALDAEIEYTDKLINDHVRVPGSMADQQVARVGEAAMLRKQIDVASDEEEAMYTGRHVSTVGTIMFVLGAVFGAFVK